MATTSQNDDTNNDEDNNNNNEDNNNNDEDDNNNDVPSTSGLPWEQHNSFESSGEEEDEDELDEASVEEEEPDSTETSETESEADPYVSVTSSSSSALRRPWQSRSGTISSPMTTSSLRNLEHQHRVMSPEEGATTAAARSTEVSEIDDEDSVSSTWSAAGDL